MKTQSMLLALAAAPSALAHTLFTDFFINGKEVGDAVAMRIAQDPETATNPLNDLSSNNLACNVGGEKGVSRVQTVQDGNSLTFEFRAWPSDPKKERLDRGHKGPCAVYLKKVDSAIKDQGHGDGWFKIHDSGYDAASKEWCSDKLIDNNGLYTVALPKGLEGGYYLARPELLALHAANAGDPQFYASCAQIYLESTGDLVPESTVSIPGYVKKDDDSVTFDIYNQDNAKYKLPGPPIAKLTSGGASGTTSGQGGQIEGKKPEGCILENGNWCGKEIPDYSDEAGCWDSGKNCWMQADDCWNSAGPTGNSGCEIWQDKCQAINDACNAKNFKGPPNKGKDLTPQKKSIDVGTVLPTSGGGVVSSPTSSKANDKPAPASSTSVKAEPTSSKKDEATPSTTSKKIEYEAVVPVAEETSKPAVTSAPSSKAPAPSKGQHCPPGYHCVTRVHTVTKTEIVYATVMPDYHNKRRGIHQRRR